jgi:hypothetical protein
MEPERKRKSFDIIWIMDNQDKEIPLKVLEENLKDLNSREIVHVLGCINCLRKYYMELNGLTNHTYPAKNALSTNVICGARNQLNRQRELLEGVIENGQS